MQLAHDIQRGADARQRNADADAYGMQSEVDSNRNDAFRLGPMQDGAATPPSTTRSCPRSHTTSRGGSTGMSGPRVQHRMLTQHDTSQLPLRAQRGGSPQQPAVSAPPRGFSHEFSLRRVMKSHEKLLGLPSTVSAGRVLQSAGGDGPYRQTVPSSGSKGVVGSWGGAGSWGGRGGDVLLLAGRGGGGFPLSSREVGGGSRLDRPSTSPRQSPQRCILTLNPGP